MDDGGDADQSLGGNRNKISKTTAKLKAKTPYSLKEKKEQEEIIRAKAEAKAARRRLLAKAGGKRLS